MEGQPPSPRCQSLPSHPDGIRNLRNLRRQTFLRVVAMCTMLSMVLAQERPCYSEAVSDNTIGNFGRCNDGCDANDPEGDCADPGALIFNLSCYTASSLDCTSTMGPHSTPELKVALWLSDEMIRGAKTESRSRVQLILNSVILRLLL
nr:hypothetical protein CFP56_21294 [Quercus suber]